tara:strand:+ start:2977 stop:3558 length:582 start_codon:yes stop_codon:yes gene_type:complete
MRVILKQRVEKLGQMGDIVEVKPGYARNFLFPNGHADRATEQKIAEFEAQRAQLEAQNLELVKEARAVADKMEGLKIILVRSAGESGHLYGSVRSADLAEAITEAGFTVSRHQVRIEKPIKELGIYKIRVALHPEVDVEVTLNIGLTKEEALAMTEESLNAAKEKLLEDKKAPVFESLHGQDDEDSENDEASA